MLRRSPFKRPDRPLRMRDRDPQPLPTVRSLHRGVMALCLPTPAPAPKTEPWRLQRLLDMAEGRPCLLQIPGVCRHDPATTVAAHSNLSIHGKGGRRKADDCYSVWSCANCHSWLDQGTAPRADKEAAFMRAHADQVLAWRWIAQDPSESEPDRRAVKSALERLEALP